MIKHGHAKRGAHASEYDVWNAMHQRCSNRRCKAYPIYGGRGINVCERWSGEDGYKSFIEDMGECPEGRSLDRIDNSKGYSPENCRWATRKEQQRNRDCNNNVEINGEVRCVTEWAEILGINIRTVRKRMNALGWDAESALLQPVVRGAKVIACPLQLCIAASNEWPGEQDGKHNEARRISYRVLRLLEIDWLWCVPKHYVTLRHRLLRKDCVMVRYRPDTDSFEWLGKDKLFFTVFSNNRLITREVIDERAARYFESAVRGRQRQGVGVDVGRGLG